MGLEGKGGLTEDFAGGMKDVGGVGCLEDFKSSLGNEGGGGAGKFGKPILGPAADDGVITDGAGGGGAVGGFGNWTIRLFLFTGF
jgi:hypothetical protein